MKPDEYLLITGASGGLGEEICRHFYKSYGLILLDKKNQPDFVSKLINDGGEIEYFSIDLQDEHEVMGIRKDIQNRHKYLKGLVLAAAVMNMSSFKELTLNKWRETLEVNLTANFIICKELAPILTHQKGGHIITIGSVLGKVAGYDMVAYSTSKAALIHFTRNLALELIESNVYVNCICPGFMKTEMFNAVMTNVNKNKN
ncbi:MAG: SDR family NAD(P)-dependent oxidoreductase [Clostridia bacterium]